MSDPTASESPKRWDAPAIDGSDGKGYMTAGRLQELQKDAYEEAWAKGHADGLEAGEDAVLERAERFDQLLNALARPFDLLDESVETQLVELSMMVVRQLFRREISTDPSHVIGVVRDAIQLLPIATREPRLHLHPDDAALIREALSPTRGEPAWVIEEDSLITRGGCRVTTDTSQIDATAESRLTAAISAISGDERK